MHALRAKRIDKSQSSFIPHTIWVANFRSDVQADASGAPPRPLDLSFEAVSVSVPATHAPGKIEWPDGPPDASTDFVTIGQRQFETINRFASDVARSDQSRLNETLVFVHGYNTRHAEAVYQLAQFVHDFEVPVPPVLFCRGHRVLHLWVRWWFCRNWPCERD